MKKNILFAFVLLLVASIASCKKDPAPSGGNNGQPSDTIVPSNNDTIVTPGNDTVPVLTDIIHFGDTTGMIVTIHDSIMEYDEMWSPFILDLDSDGTDDIKIETYYDGPLAVGETQTLTLFCLNQQIEILADSIIKECYSHRSSTIDTLNEYVITAHSYVFSTCGPIVEGTPASTSKVFDVFAFNAGEVLDINAHFQLGNSQLFRQNIEYSLTTPNGANHAISVNQYKYDYSCWNFPTDSEKYIGFRIARQGKTRYGWLKIKLIPTWDDRVVNTELIETAIQKQGILNP